MTESTKFSAAAPLAGYIFQCRLALLRGLQIVKTKANCQISIEKFDDVAFETDNVAECLMQAKHHIEAKSLTDKSPDIWKTLRVWMHQLQEGVIQLSSTSLFLITTAKADEGSAMSLLRSGSTAKDRVEARQLLKAAATASKSLETKPAREAFLKLSDEEIDAMLARVEVIDGHSNLTDTMDEIEGEMLIAAPDNVALASQYLEGWWLSEIGMRLIDASIPPISAQNIVKKANEIGKMFGEDSLPVDDPASLGVKPYSKDDEAHVFVRQMRLVKAPDSTIKRGVNDFYRASAQRSKWARENLLIDGETQKYDDKLQDAWGRKFDEETASLDLSDSEKCTEIGRTVFFWASRQSHGFRNVVETWITAGSLHGLSDRRLIGWHPNFEKLLQPEAADVES